MKKHLLCSLAVLVLALLMVLAPAMADKAHSLSAVFDYTSLTVGTVTPFSGNFFSQIFGNNGTDMDVQMLLHAYSPVEWNSTSACYQVNSLVASAILATDESSTRTYHVFLCEDLRYSDGSPITAGDYVFSLLLSSDPLIDEIGGSSKDLSNIVGWKEWAEGSTDTVTGIRLLSDTAFTISVYSNTLPNFYELKVVDFGPYPLSVILPGCTVVDDGKGVKLDDPNGLHTADGLKAALLDAGNGYVTHPTVVSGPYQLESYNGKAAVFKLNPYYKGNVNGVVPSIENITYMEVAEEQGVKLLTEGKIGLLHKTTQKTEIDKGIKLVSENEYRMTAYPRNGGSFFTFCCERIVPGDEAVRQAVAYCLDKDALVATYVGHYGLRADGYYGLGQWMYTLTGNEGLSEAGVKVYNQDLEAAADVLDDGGWNLNEAGGAYKGKGIRYKAFSKATLEKEGKLEAALNQGGREKTVKGKECVLMPLKLKLYIPEENDMRQVVRATLLAPLEKVGIELTVIEMPFENMLLYYYGEKERICDMMFLGTNFMVGFDPTNTFALDASAGVNVTGIRDESLAKAAADMIRTTQGDVDTYLEKWITFQKRFQESAPAIFVYSNMYFDFYTYSLNNYHINDEIAWPKAIVEAYLGDPVEDPNPEDVQEYVFE